MHMVSLFNAALLLLLGLSAPVVARTSTDGSCGGDVTCLGSSSGPCCSQWGYCGSTDAHCGAGCQPSLGTCQTTSSSAGSISRDSTCGGSSGYSCKGSQYGDCCSRYNYCGRTDEYCGAGCQSVFGDCSGNRVASSSFVGGVRQRSSVTRAAASSNAASNIIAPFQRRSTVSSTTAHSLLQPTGIRESQYVDQQPFLRKSSSYSYAPTSRSVGVSSSRRPTSSRTRASSSMVTSSSVSSSHAPTPTVPQCTPLVNGGFEDVPSIALGNFGTQAGGWALEGRTGYFENNNYESSGGQQIYTPYGDQFAVLFLYEAFSVGVSQEVALPVPAPYLFTYSPFFQQDSVGNGGLCTFTASIGSIILDRFPMSGNFSGEITRSASFVLFDHKPTLRFRMDCTTVPYGPIFNLYMAIDDVAITATSPGTGRCYRY